MSPTRQTNLNGAVTPSARNGSAERSTAAIERVQAALSCLRAGQPICILSGNEGTTNGWLVAGADSHLRFSAELLLQRGQGPLFLVRSGEEWSESRIEPNWLPIAKISSCAPDPPMDALESVAGIVWGILAGGVAYGEVPEWLQCISPQPGGVLRHVSVTEASYALACSTTSRSVLLRRVANDSTRACCFQILDLLTILEYQRAMNQRTPLRLPVAARIPTLHGEFRMEIFSEPWTGLDYSALIKGDVGKGGPVLVRLHSACFTGDIVGSLRCDCGAQMDAALARITEERRGILLYLPQEGRGIGLYHKLQAYVAQDAGLDTVEANEHQGLPSDLREYSQAAGILKSLGVHEVRLLTNNPHKISSLEENGIRVVEREPLIIEPNPENLRYLETKRTRMGHLLIP